MSGKKKPLVFGPGALYCNRTATRFTEGYRSASSRAFVGRVPAGREAEQEGRLAPPSNEAIEILYLQAPTKMKGAQ